MTVSYVSSAVDVNNNCILTNKLKNIWRSGIIKISAEEQRKRGREHIFIFMKIYKKCMLREKFNNLSKIEVYICW